MTEKEKRDEIIILRVSPADKERIRLKMEELGIQNMSAYIRKMALDGYCVNLDLTDVKELVHLLRQCSNNLNQYTKKPTRPAASTKKISGIYRNDSRHSGRSVRTFSRGCPPYSDPANVGICTGKQQV